MGLVPSSTLARNSTPEIITFTISGKPAGAQVALKVPGGAGTCLLIDRALCNQRDGNGLDVECGC